MESPRGSLIWLGLSGDRSPASSPDRPTDVDENSVIGVPIEDPTSLFTKWPRGSRVFSGFTI